MTTNASRCGSRQTFSSATSSPNSNRCSWSNGTLPRPLLIQKPKISLEFGSNNSPPRTEIPLRSVANAPSGHLKRSSSPHRSSELDHKQCGARESKTRRITEYLVELAEESRVYHRSVPLSHKPRSGRR